MTPEDHRTRPGLPHVVRRPGACSALGRRAAGARAAGVPRARGGGAALGPTPEGVAPGATDAATERRGPGWEVDLFGAVNDLPDWLRWPIWPVMQLGNFWMAR